MRKILLFSLLLAPLGLWAQQDAQFTQYMFNTLYYNPAYAGVEGYTTVTAMHRSQWLGYESTFDGPGAPNTQYVGITTPIFRIPGGFGIHVVNDNIAERNNLEIQTSFAYHIRLDKDLKLSVGVRAGIYSMAIDFDRYRWINPDDPLNRFGREAQFRPDLGAGVWFRSEKIFAGASFNHLIQSEFDFGSDSLRNPLESHMTLTGGYDYEMNVTDLVLTPMILLRSDFNTYSYEVSFKAEYKDRIWGGLSYRQSDAMILFMGYSIFDPKDFKDKGALKVGYGFDYIVQGQNAKQPTSHEFMLTYILPPVNGSVKKSPKTPRYELGN